jgi:hypothetical protein
MREDKIPKKTHILWNKCYQGKLVQVGFFSDDMGHERSTKMRESSYGKAESDFSLSMYCSNFYALL